MPHFHFIGLDELPEPIKRMLIEQGESDTKMRQIRHELVKREEAAFWSSLDKDQLRWLIRLLAMVAEDDEPGQVASRELGRAEGYMEQRFKSCGCGDVHRDPDDFMKDLTDRMGELSIEERELDELDIKRIEPSMFVRPEHVGKFHCTRCQRIFDSVEDRKKAAVGESHDGCVDSSD